MSPVEICIFQSWIWSNCHFRFNVCYYLQGGDLYRKVTSSKALVVGAGGIGESQFPSSFLYAGIAVSANTCFQI